MKYLIFLMMVSISFGAVSGEISRKQKAQYRAAQHPKGSGIGTNRYTTGRYDRVPYSIDKYQRQYPTGNYQQRSYRSKSDYGENITDKQKAKYRASQHPKGSGIGTNKYNTERYDGDYPIDRYLHQ